MKNALVGYARRAARYISHLSFRFESPYALSNRVTSVAVEVWPELHAYIPRLLCSSSAQERQQLGTELLDGLCDAAGINIVKLKISETRQYHRKRGGRIVMKRYGYYRPSSAYIYIQNMTAVRGCILAPKTFLDTLLHEWVHHYDYQKLRIPSYHTKGFYERIRSLKQLLGVPVQRRCT